MKITSLSFLMIFFVFTSFAQEELNPDRHQFGIMMNANASSFNEKLSDWTILGIDQEISSVKANYRYGFDLGILYIYELNNFISISPQAILSFQEKELSFDLLNDIDLNEKYENVSVNIPLHALFSFRVANFRPGLTIGTNYEFYINESDAEQKLNLSGDNWSFDVGPSIEFDFKKFKLRPSIIYSYGLKELKQGQNDFYNNAFSSIKTENISLRIAFYN